MCDMHLNSQELYLAKAGLLWFFSELSESISEKTSSFEFSILCWDPDKPIMPEVCETCGCNIFCGKHGKTRFETLFSFF